MKLVIGGYAQGKLNYVKLKYHIDEKDIFDGELPKNENTAKRFIVVNRLHRWVRECILSGKNPEEEIRRASEAYPDCIWISDEIGNGIVPEEAFEREYRERMGRILTELAKNAERVERVICGLGQRIK